MHFVLPFLHLQLMLVFVSIRYYLYAVVKHIDQNKEHNINFNKVKILHKEQNYGKRLIKETIKIEKCPANFNKEDGWKICSA